jgi:hypothetical protein
MRSEQNEVRSRSGAEVAFVVMRALATARLLWARDGALPIEMLPALVEAPAEAIALTIDGLCDEGLAEVSELDATVRLTDRAMRDLCNGSELFAPPLGSVS